MDTNNLESTVSLDELFDPVNPEGKLLKTFKSYNCGKATLNTVLSIFEFHQYSDIANDRMGDSQQSQRPLDPKHAKEFAEYILKALVQAAINKKRKHGEPVSDEFSVVQGKIIWRYKAGAGH